MHTGINSKKETPVQQGNHSVPNGESRPASVQMKGLQEMADNSIGVQQSKAIQEQADRSIQQIAAARGSIQRKEVGIQPVQMVTAKRFWKLLYGHVNKAIADEIYEHLMQKYDGHLENLREDNIINEIAKFLKEKKEAEPAKKGNKRKRRRKRKGKAKELNKEREKEKTKEVEKSKDKENEGSTSGFKEEVKKRRKRRKRKGKAKESDEESERKKAKRAGKSKDEENEEPAFSFTDHYDANYVPKTKKEFWLEKAGELKKRKSLNVEVKKIAVILLIYKQGVFSATGQGGNIDYIRSKSNTVLELIGKKLSAGANTAGELPDLYKDITPDDFIAIINALKEESDFDEKEGAEMTNESDSLRDQHIERQRIISQEIVAKLGKGREYKDKDTGKKIRIMTFIFEGNYPALTIHFPALHAYIREDEQKHSGKLTFSSMTKFLMARLISAYNVEKGDKKPLLAEKSSFGFEDPTMDDLGEHLSIRLSPGIYIETVEPFVNAIQKLEIEVHELMTSSELHRFDYDGNKEGDDIRKYWGTGKRGKVQADENWASYTREKSILDHLLFTLMEKGDKKVSILGRVFERNPQNIIALSEVNASLLEIGKEILKLHNLGDVENAIAGESLRAPQLLSNEAMEKIKQNEKPDNEAKRRLSILSKIAADFDKMAKEEKAEWKDEVSDSEYESGGEYGDKVITPSGMASLDQLLVKPPPEKSGKSGKSKKSRMTKNSLGRNKDADTYYEFKKHNMKELNIGGYITSDAYVVDLNPNITHSEQNKIDDINTGGVNRQVMVIIEKLEQQKKKVWIVDITSSTTAEQQYLYQHWKEDASAELLIQIGSGLKNEQEGLNMNTYGTIHWAYKKAEKDDMTEALKTYFDATKKLPVNTRSVVSNAIRRHFKKRGTTSWKHIRSKTGNASRKGKEKSFISFDKSES